MSTKNEYIGELTEDGVVPFIVAAPDGLHEDAQAKLQETRGIEFIECDKAEDAPDADGMFIRSATNFRTAADFERNRLVKYLIRVGVNFKNINLEKASTRGVATLNTPGASTTPVAQRVISFIHMWKMRAKENMKKCEKGEWDKKGLTPNTIPDPSTLGIIGFGRIGQETERLAKAGELFSNYLHSEPLDPDGSVSIEELLRKSDVISVSAGGEDAILTPDNLKLLKDLALVVNTSRGPLVDKQGILDCLKENERNISYYTDVFWKEGPTMFEDDPQLNEFINHPNFFATQHTAASDKATQRELGMEGTRRMVQFITEGKVNPHGINGHTIPSFYLKDDGSEEIGYNLIITHESLPGKLETITGACRRAGINIIRHHNDQGNINGGHRLAITALHVGPVPQEQMLKTAKEIDLTAEAYNTRVAVYKTL